MSDAPLLLPMTAAAWLAALAQNGEQVRLHNGRLRIVPASAYKALSDEQLLFLRHHRDEIKASLAAPDARSPIALPTSRPKPSPSPPLQRAALTPHGYALSPPDTCIRVAGWGPDPTPLPTLEDWQAREARVSAIKAAQAAAAPVESANDATVRQLQAAQQRPIPPPED